MFPGYGSGGGSNVSPNLPKSSAFPPDGQHEGSHSSDSDGSPACTLSRSLKEDIRSCLGGCRYTLEQKLFIILYIATRSRSPLP